MKYAVLATEDQLSEEVGFRLLKEVGFEASVCLRKNGNGYLQKRIPNLCEMAIQQPVLLLTDLDRLACPTQLIANWIGARAKPSELIFRVVVRTIESWLLADHEGMRRLLGPRTPKLPSTPDELQEPKQTLLGLANRGTRAMREDLVANNGAIASQGIGYNAVLSTWIRDDWAPARAATRSPSLERARLRLGELAAKY
ncbi:DUF4276 family protein [Paraburkholderia sp. Ac-20340]|nr:DUF4276 family protein [Paraburkholderia sp. Ac-20340]